MILPRRLLVLAVSLAAVLTFTPSPAGAKARPSPPASPAPSASPALPVAPEPPAAPELPELAGVRVRGGEGRVAIGTPLRVGPNEVVEGDAVCLGCSAEIEGKVQGDLVVIGGKLRMTGEGTGDVVGVGSRLKLERGAKVRGQVVNVGGLLSDDGAEIAGQVQDIGISGLGFVPGLGFARVGGFLLWAKLAALLVIFVGLVLIAVIVPDRVRRISDEAPPAAGQAFLAGLLAYAALAVIQFFLVVTILGIPLAILIYFVFVVLKWLGLAGIFHQIGTRLGRRMGREMSLLPAVLLAFLLFAVVRLVPLCVGWVAWFLLEIFAVGYVVLTRAGSRPIGGFAPAAPAPPAPLPYPPAAPPPAPPLPPLP